MLLVDQIIIDKGRGDCHRAVVASLLDLELDQVPHFRLYPDDQWFNVYYYFMYSMGFEYKGCKHSVESRPLLKEDSINGFIEAAVESKTFGEGITHAVILDLDGVVVHDPNPNKLWQGINVVESGELKYWYLFDKVESRA